MPSYAQKIDFGNIEERLERALNKKDKKVLENLFSKTFLLEITQKKEDFLNRFPDSEWIIKRKEIDKDARLILNVLIKGIREIDNQKFILESNQDIAITIEEGKINNYQIIKEVAILRSIKSELKLNISIPDKVLTGSKYDADVILEYPLEDDFIAGGLISVDRNEINKNFNPYINLLPLSAGGIFKSIQAPFSPGSQTLAALIVHSKGIVSITKTIMVVSEMK